MLDIDIDSKGGILFVRLFGVLTKDTKIILKDEVFSLLNKLGINNLVINIQNVYKIDKEGLDMIKRCYRECENSLLCINPSQVNLTSYLKFTYDEMSAYNLIHM